MKNSLDITIGNTQDVQVALWLWDAAEAVDMDEVCLGSSGIDELT